MRKYEIKIILGYSISTSVFTDIYPEIEIVDLEKNDLIVEKSVNVEKIANIWLDSIKPSIKPQTFHKYQTIVNLYVIPYLGFYDIKKINEMIEENHHLKNKIEELKNKILIKSQS